MRLALLTPLAAILVLAAPDPAAASVCGQQVVEDWQDNGVVDVTYPAVCYRDALASEPADARQYSDFGAAVRRAQARDRRRAQDEAEARAAAARDDDGAAAAGGSGGGSDPSSGERGGATVTPFDAAADRPVLPVEEGGAGRDDVDASVASAPPAAGPGAEPGATEGAGPTPAVLAAPASDPFLSVDAESDPPLPAPVVAVGALAAALAAVGCAGLLAQRRRAARP